MLVWFFFKSCGSNSPFGRAVPTPRRRRSWFSAFYRCPVAAVFGILVAVIILAVARIFFKLGFKPISHNSAIVSLNRLCMSSIPPIFAACSSSLIFALLPITSELLFFLDTFLPHKVSVMFYHTLEVYTNLRMASLERYKYMIYLVVGNLKLDCPTLFA